MWLLVRIRFNSKVNAYFRLFFELAQSYVSNARV